MNPAGSTGETVSSTSDDKGYLHRALRFSSLLLLLSLLAPHACASSSDELQRVLGTLHEGDMVRVFSSSHEDPVIGRFLRSTGESIHVALDAPPGVSIDIAGIRQLDTSDEQSRATWAGLGLGALVGGLVAAAVMKGNEGSESMAGVVMVAVGIPVSIAIGGMIGSGVVNYRWQTRWRWI